MPERVYRNVDLDLDDLADGVIDWFVQDGFEVQDFIEGATIFLQAKKENLVTKLSFNSQAVNVRLTPLARGFRVDVTTGEWLDKGVGAAAAVGLRLINPLIAIGAGAATGYGIYQQLKLPERVLDYVEWYVNQHGRLDEEYEGPRQRVSTRREVEIDEDIEAMRGARDRDQAAPAPAPAASGGFCASCGAALHAGARFCHACGTSVTASAPPPADRPAASEPPPPGGDLPRVPPED